MTKGNAWPESYKTGPSTTRPRARDMREFVLAVARGEDGGTFGAGDGRYVVGGRVDSVVIRAGATFSQRADSASDFCAANPTGGIGFWKDDNTGRTWLDGVDAYDELEVAVTIAAARGELALYDRWESEVIPV